MAEGMDWKGKVDWDIYYISKGKDDD